MSKVQFRLARLAQSPFGRAAAVVAVIAAVMLPAVHPNMLGALPDTPDGLLHLYRLVALDHAIRHDGLWPRYAPGLIFGYGSPIFNYYGPLYLYPFEALHLAGLPFLDGFLAGLVLYAILGTLGAYLLGEVWSGPVAGIATAVGYAYAPYTLYNWPRRGAVAEFAAMAALPWVLWAFQRLATYGRRRDFLLAVGALAFFIPLHNITTLLGTALLIIYCLFLWLVSPDKRLTLSQLVLAGVLSVALTAFFWLPALAETGYVQLERATGPASADFHNNFDTLAETFSPPMTADLTQIHPPVPRPLGWPQLILGVLGIGLAMFAKTVAKNDLAKLCGWLALALFLVMGLVFLTNEASTWLWEIVPLMHYVQLPWRLLGPASLFLAVLAGMGVALVAKRIPWPVGQAAWVMLCLVVMIVYAMPWLYGIDLPEPRAESIVDVQNFERETGWIATSSLREYIPRWTTELPDMNRLRSLYAQSEVIPRLQPSPDIVIEQENWGATSARLVLRSASETTLIFDWLYFPGWRAWLDGEQVTAAPSEPHGLLSISVPAGEHTLEITLGPTPVRRAATYLSIGAAIGLIGLLVATRRIWVTNIDVERPSWPQEIYLVMASAALTGMLIFAGKALLIDRMDTPIQRERFAHGVEAGLQTPIQASFGQQVNQRVVLLGCDLPHVDVPSGGTLSLALYWRLAENEVEEDYSSVVTLHDPAGNVIWVTGSQHPGDWPTSDWAPGLYTQERLTLSIPPGTPPGSYDIRVGLYSHSGERNLDVFDVGGNPLGVTVRIGTLNVTRPQHPLRVSDLEIEAPLNAHLIDDLTLISMELPPASREVGQPLPLVWCWQAETQPAQIYHVQLLWLTEDNEVAATSAVIPPVSGYPTDLWAQGDVWKGMHTLHIPGRLEAGEYSLAVQMIDSIGEPIGERVVIGQIMVTTPVRVFDIPSIPIRADIAWQNGIRLLGYDLPNTTVSPESDLALTLYWQPEGEISASLKVFVHLVDSEGAIITQQDQEPANGTRPTTGWAPEEIITDLYTLLIGPEVPAGEYSIRIGWYDPTTGERVSLPGGGDFWVLPQVVSVVAEP